MKTIENREDVRILVHAFYAKIRKHPSLGPIFNASIADDHWPAHLEKLTDFWESNLFGIAKFRGNPPAAHQRMDQKENHSISQTHFGYWLQLWYETIGEMYEGELADRAKNLARRMSTGLFLAIWNGRPQEVKSIKGSEGK